MRLKRLYRALMLIASGGVVFQTTTTSCTPEQLEGIAKYIFGLIISASFSRL